MLRHKELLHWQGQKRISRLPQKEVPKALQKVFSTYVDGTPKARIIDCVHDFKLMSWEDWSKVKPAEDEEGIRTPNSIFRIPEIIIYTRYDKLPQQKVHYNRRQIYHRDANRCQYCGFRKPNNELSLDHVVPKCQGGKSVWENVVVACVVTADSPCARFEISVILNSISPDLN
mgnify:CR=1 FL=1